MVTNIELGILYERNAAEKDSVEARILEIDKKMAELAIGRFRLAECVGAITHRMEGLQQQIFGDLPEIPPEVTDFPVPQTLVTIN
jgi:hypothetical protein